MIQFRLTANEAKNKLMEGNKKYIQAKTGSGDISMEIRHKTCVEGQHPYAIIITCSDSRVLPEEIFSAGIGELFVIQVAGNVIDKNQLGSIEYGIEHLKCGLVLVLGHDHCGAIDATIHMNRQFSYDPSELLEEQEQGSYIQFITNEIADAIGDETDDIKACCLNIRHSIEMIHHSLLVKEEEKHGLEVLGAIYHIDSGEVEFLDTSLS